MLTLKYRPLQNRFNSSAFRYLRPFQKQEFHLSWFFFVDYLNSSPVTADQICEATKCDPQLSDILQFAQQGWPSRNLDGHHWPMLFEGKHQFSTNGFVERAVQVVKRGLRKIVCMRIFL